MLLASRQTGTKLSRRLRHQAMLLACAKTGTKKN
jgi:hypothetical protein